MNVARPHLAAAGAIPRECNFAADILKRNLDARPPSQGAYIDQHGNWT